MAEDAKRPARAPAASPAETEATSGERRQVTVLFADLSHFTEMATEVDPEELREIINTTFDAIHGIIAEYNGSVNSFIGDAVMAIFGAPVAHDDDSLRAVRAAKDIHKAMTVLSEREGHQLKVHVGIASGEVVAAPVGSSKHKIYTVLGESVNLASRLHDKAKPEETLISEPVFRAVVDYFACEPLGEIAMPGLERAVPVWRVLDLRAMDAARVRTPIVGRQAEIRQFISAVESCRETKTGQVIIVRGEAGIGKTRLTEEFVSIAERRGMASYRVQVLNFGGGKGKDSIRLLVRSLLAIPACTDALENQKAVDAMIEAQTIGSEQQLSLLEPGESKVVAERLLQANQMIYLNDLLDVPQPPEMRAAYAVMDNAMRNIGKQSVVSTLIRTLSARRPILITVEDVHWAEAVTLAHLRTMAATVRDCPAILVLTMRNEDNPWNFGTTSSMTIDLGHLRPEEAIALATQYTQRAHRFLMNCVERAAGNPLFLEQLLRSAEESRDEAIPASIQSLILARMDRLPPADKRSLQAAAVIGQRFDLDLLRYLTSTPNYDCKYLVEHFLVKPEAPGFSFTHSLIQEVAYSSLLKSAARELHRLAAAWFQQRDPTLYAQHLDRANDNRAAAAYLDAARCQISEFHNIQARILIERGIQLGGERSVQYDLTSLLGVILWNLGDKLESIEAYKRALALAGDERQRCLAWIGMAEGMRDTGNYTESLEVLKKAENVALKLDLEEELARIYTQRGNLYFPRGDVETCLKQQGLALQFARKARSPEAQARALSGLGDAEYARGRMMTAHKYFNECLDLCQQHGYARIELENLQLRGLTAFYQNDFTLALNDCAAGIDAATRAQNQRAEMVARLAAAPVHLEMMDLPRAREQCERSQQLARHANARGFESECLLYLAMILALEGAHLEAEECAEKAVAISVETSKTFTGPWALGTLAMVTENAAKRCNALRDGEKMLQETCVGHNHLWFYRNAIKVSLKTEDWDAVERYAVKLEGFIRPEPVLWSVFYIAWGRALTHFGRGARDSATIAELARLRTECERIALRAAVPELDSALAVNAGGVAVPASERFR